MQTVCVCVRYLTATIADDADGENEEKKATIDRTDSQKKRRKK